MIKQKKILSYLLSAGLLTAGTAGALSAQSNSDRSPYSRFGYGTLGMRQTATTRALGGIGVGLRDGLVVNPANPASYTAVDSMTFHQWIWPCRCVDLTSLRAGIVIAVSWVTLITLRSSSP